ncbi:DUF4136 domain-containing protein [Pseudoxanthomonas suwonensis]|uniref:Type IV secretion system putative lipoprotein virB7 n=1 Tax=Pseudoxanthomonas suwonensis TaxID=314722 RepID=A0A0E3UMA8_9GAMM|nr:DUF4136 domain-containing protein [Pseudoxanthomonas suwonensis]AKC85880.1 hypothetical protein WQ53_02970 [Pseudoxanthomonas suwonensis]
MKRSILAAFALVAVAACSSTPTVHTDSDPQASFGSYRTYTWLAKPEGVSPLVAQRIVDGVDARLRAQGWTQAADADVAVAAHVTTQQKQTLDTLYSGPMYGGWGWARPGLYGGMGVGMGSATTTVHNYTVGTLIVDLFDAKTKQAIWRGTASDTASSSPDKVNAAVDAGIAKMFEGFPPGRAPAN